MKHTNTMTLEELFNEITYLRRDHRRMNTVDRESEKANAIVNRIMTLEFEIKIRELVFKKYETKIIR
jgi:hypothetical protein